MKKEPPALNMGRKITGRLPARRAAEGAYIITEDKSSRTRQEPATASAARYCGGRQPAVARTFLAAPTIVATDGPQASSSGFE